MTTTFVSTAIGSIAAELGNQIADQLMPGPLAAPLLGVTVVADVAGTSIARSWSPGTERRWVPDRLMDDAMAVRDAMRRGDVSTTDGVAEIRRLVSQEPPEGGEGPPGETPAGEEGRTAGGGFSPPCTGSSSRDDAPSTADQRPDVAQIWVEDDFQAARMLTVLRDADVLASLADDVARLVRERS